MAFIQGIVHTRSIDVYLADCQTENAGYERYIEWSIRNLDDDTGFWTLEKPGTIEPNTPLSSKSTFENLQSGVMYRVYAKVYRADDETEASIAEFDCDFTTLDVDAELEVDYETTSATIRIYTDRGLYGSVSLQLFQWDADDGDYTIEIPLYEGEHPSLDGSGYFEFHVYGLSPGTKYYVKADINDGEYQKAQYFITKYSGNGSFFVSAEISYNSATCDFKDFGSSGELTFTLYRLTPDGLTIKVGTRTVHFSSGTTKIRTVEFYNLYPNSNYRLEVYPLVESWDGFDFTTATYSFTPRIGGITSNGFVLRALSVPEDLDEYRIWLREYGTEETNHYAWGDFSSFKYSEVKRWGIDNHVINELKPNTKYEIVIDGYKIVGDVDYLIRTITTGTTKDVYSWVYKGAKYDTNVSGYVPVKTESKEDAKQNGDEWFFYITSGEWNSLTQRINDIRMVIWGNSTGLHDFKQAVDYEDFTCGMYNEAVEKLNEAIEKLNEEKTIPLPTCTFGKKSGGDDISGSLINGLKDMVNEVFDYIYGGE